MRPKNHIQMQFFLGVFKLKILIFSIIQHIHVHVCLCTSKESWEQALSISIIYDMRVVHFAYLNLCQNANILCVYAVLRATMHFFKKFFIRTAIEASKFASALIFTPEWKNNIKSDLRLDCTDKNYRIQKNRKQLSFLKIWVRDKSWSVSQIFAPTEGNNVRKPTLQWKRGRYLRPFI